MKKAFALVLTIALIAALAVTSFAAIPADMNHDYFASYKSGVDETAVYSLDVQWDSNMTFTYNAGTAGWSPEDLAYVPNNDGSWKDDTVSISIVNHSNKAVDATVTVANVSNSGVVVAVAGAATQQIASAVGVAVDKAPAVSFSLVASGTPAESLNNAKLATVTVTLKKAV